MIEILRMLDIKIYYKLGGKVDHVLEVIRQKAKPICLREGARWKQDFTQRGWTENNLMKGPVIELWAELRNH